MATRAITWPKVIGVAVTAFGLGCMMYAAGTLGRLGIITADSGLLLIIGVIFLSLSFPLCRARDWARRALFAVLLVISVGLLVFCFELVIGRPNIAYDFNASRVTAEQLAEVRFYERLIRLSKVGIAICTVSLPVCLTWALLHPDVVGAFRGAPRSRENV